MFVSGYFVVYLQNGKLRFKVKESPRVSTV